MSVAESSPTVPATAAARPGQPFAFSPVPLGHSRRHHVGFWVAATAFLVNMAFSAVPTPLYSLFQRRDRFSTITVTVIYAVYALGVIASLLLAGHVSDWVGRRRMLVPALLVNVVSAAVFLAAPSLAGLLVARVLSGVSVGLSTATATAYLAELHGRTKWRTGRRADLVATGANLGGIGFGPLVAGVLAQYAPTPLRLPFIVFAFALLVLAGLVALSPETVERSETEVVWRPQRIAVPAEARARFFAASFAGAATFAVFGVFNSVAPALLAGTLGRTSHALAGLVAFSVFASAAVSQILLGRVAPRHLLLVGPAVLVPGMAVLVAGMWAPSLPLFVVGGVFIGAGGGLLFRACLVTAASTAPTPAVRGEVLAGFFVGAYVGLSLPVVGLGIATEHASAKVVMVYFLGVIAAAVVLGARAARR